MNLDLNALGFTQDELQERVVSKICEVLLSSVEYDPESDVDYPVSSKFKQAIEKKIQNRIDETINALAEKYVLPNVTQYIETLTIQKTNQWGEKTGERLTFIEYLTKQAENYMSENVDFQGKTKADSGSYSWNGTQTRITHLVNAHLHYSIEKAMKDALSIATSAISTGINETCKVKLEEISKSLKVSVAAK